MEPDQIFIHLATAIYFCGWLWLGFSVGAVPLRPAMQPLFSLLIGSILVVTVAGWGYLALSVLLARSNPFRLPLTMVLLLSLTLAASYFPIKPWRLPQTGTIPNGVKMARLELLGLLVLIPTGGLLIVAPLGTDILGWLPSLLESYPILLILIGLLAIGTVAGVEPGTNRFLLTLGLLLAALLTTYLTMIIALVATI